MTKEQSLLPSNEPQILRFLECVASDTLEHCDLESINTLPLSARAELLPYLAFMFDVDITNLSEGEARRLILNAIEIHRYAGTLYAVKKALQTCFSDYEIKEWFDFDGKPFTFKLEVTIGTDLDAVFDAKKWIKARDLIYWAKNERSQLLGIEVKLPEARGDIFVSAGLVYEAEPEGNATFHTIRHAQIVESVASVTQMSVENEARLNRNTQCVLMQNSANTFEIKAKGESIMQQNAVLMLQQRGAAVWLI